MPAVQLERLETCNLCGSASADILWQDVEDPVCGLPGAFSLVRCSACQLIYLNPRPTPGSIALCYPDNYPSHLPAATGPETMRRRFESLVFWPCRRLYGPKSPRTPPPFGTGRCLEVGCGKGQLLREFQRAGWDVTGIEPSAKAVAMARQAVPDGTIVEGTLETVGLRDDHFDVAILWHVLEHLHDPMRALQIVHRRMRTGGRLLLALPNIGSCEARIFGRYWVNLDVPRHLFHYSVATLSRLLAATGFRMTWTRPQINPSTISSSCAYFLKRHGISLPPLAGRLVYAAMSPAASLSYTMGDGGNMEVWATRIEP